MPIVFVHGVATRRGTQYDEAVALRDALLRRYVYDRLGLDAGVSVTNAYWGDEAADFRWHHASVPSEGVEAFGSDAPLEDVLLAEMVDGDIQSDDRVLLSIAVADPESAFDLLWSAAAKGVQGEDADAFSGLAQRASQLMPRLSAADVASAATDEELVERWVEILVSEQPVDPEESFGSAINKALDGLNEGLIRVRGAGNRLLGRGAVKLLRSKLHESGALFMGDVMSYLNERGSTLDEAGSIASKVMSDLDQAVAQAPDTPLVVIAHSMGGNIAYDILSHFRPDLECDLLLTVGSQVGLFEELCLLARGKQERCPEIDKVSALPNVHRWMNVFDYNDVLGFAASKIFDGAQDFAYSTGTGVVKAHGSYFVRPSFYRRLAERIGS